MATTTPNFGFDIPQSTDLVKDGATAIAALGTDIDTAFVDLKGGTTGQVLSKASGTDLDFTWVTDAAGDITGVTAGTGISGGGTSGTVTVTNSMATAIDAKGDLIGGTGADAFARLAIGTNGQVLTADSAETTGMKWATTASGGGQTTLASGSLSGSSLSLGSLNQTYRNLRLVISNFYLSGANDIRVKINSNSSSIYDKVQIIAEANTFRSVAAIDAANLGLNYNNPNNASTPQTVIIDLPNYTDTTSWKVINVQSYYKSYASGSAEMAVVFGGARTTSAVTTLEFYSGVSFSGGTYELIGIK